MAEPWPHGPFRTIVADPPWRFQDLGSRVRTPYPTLKTSEICALPVAELAGPKAHLYLWVVDAFKEAGYNLVRVWGFEPKLEIVWVYFRHAHESCIFAIRGGLRTLDGGLSTVLMAPRGTHSQKPEAFSELVERASPGPYLELFARRQRPGWTCWGNEVCPVGAEVKP